MPNWSRPEFDWDDGNESHFIKRHDVYPEEAEQVFFNGAYIRRTGAVYAVYGRDDTGRYLFLICILRGSAVRVFSAHTMTRDERRFYERFR
jgi:uncharacterized DUF497 family protein